MNKIYIIDEYQFLLNALKKDYTVLNKIFTISKTIKEKDISFKQVIKEPFFYITLKKFKKDYYKNLYQRIYSIKNYKENKRINEFLSYVVKNKNNQEDNLISQTWYQYNDLLSKILYSQNFNYFINKKTSKSYLKKILKKDNTQQKWIDFTNSIINHSEFNKQLTEMILKRINFYNNYI